MTRYCSLEYWLSLASMASSGSLCDGVSDSKIEKFHAIEGRPAFRLWSIRRASDCPNLNPIPKKDSIEPGCIYSLAKDPFIYDSFVDYVLWESK